MTQPTRDQQIAALEKDWAENPRWKGIKRGYAAADVVRLRGSLAIEHTIARRGAENVYEGIKHVHVSGHGSEEELKQLRHLLLKLVQNMQANRELEKV